MVSRLFASYAGTPTCDSFGQNQEIGSHFRPVVDGYAREVSWYRCSVVATDKPIVLRIWDNTLQIVVYTVPAIPDNGSVGWQRFDVPLDVVISAQHDYWVTGQWPAGRKYAYDNATNLPVPPYPLAFVTPARGYAALGTYGRPVNADTTFLQLVEIGFDQASPSGDSPATVNDVDNAMAGWLSVSDGTHADSAPLQDHATLATVNTNTAAVKAAADDWAFGLGAAAHGYYADVKTLISNIKSITDTLPTPIAQLTSIVLDHYTADIAGILTQIDTVLSNLGAQSTDLSGTAGSAVGALSGRTGFPATGWSMAAEADFEDAIAFAEPADAYVLSITSYQDTQPANASPAGLWLPRLGWWCVLNGTLAAQRQFVDFEHMILDDQGRRMPGCAIQLRPGTLATVQAWLLA